jgi:glycosyltransferase involved in cell wall biosynthesis
MTLTAFMAPHIRVMSRSWAITLVATGTRDTMSDLCGPNVTFERVAINRRISIAADLVSLVNLWRLFRRHRFHAVLSISHKAGLLAMIAGRAAGVPVRVHWLTGQVWATRRGFVRWLLKSLDRVLVRCSTHLLADSASQRAFLIDQGVLRPGQVTVLGHGSVCGVDTSRFKPDPDLRREIRDRFGIPETAVTALFLGRLTRDKGLPELVSAFDRASAACPDLHLLVVGPDEEGLTTLIADRLARVRDRIHLEDHTPRPQAFMAAADFFVSPSHREGFGMTVIEAAACGIPAVATKIYGLSDAVEDGESGILIDVADVDALSAALTRLANDHGLRRKMGEAARRRVEAYFMQADLTEALRAFYARLTEPAEAVKMQVGP